MKQADLIAEIEGLIISECEEQKRAVAKAWICQAILERHTRIEGADADFALLCVKEHVEDSVEQVVRRYRPKRDPRTDRQMTFPGYEFIQKVYTIDRDGESMVVPTEQMSPSELRSKAKEHRQMGAGHYAHADELDRLADEREAAAGSDA